MARGDGEGQRDAQIIGRATSLKLSRHKIADTQETKILGTGVLRLVRDKHTKKRISCTC